MGSRSVYSSSLSERLSYGLYFLGQNFFYILVAMFIQVYFTDMGITASAVAIILLVTKIWDAVNDPIFGIIVDRTRFKKGRFMPWIRISLVFIAATTMFIFLMPISASPMAKIVWAVISYILWDIAYTVCDVPIFALSTSMTDNMNERTAILSLGRFMGTIGSMAIVVLLPTIRPVLGWTATAAIITIAGFIFMIPLCFIGKERVKVRKQEKITYKQMIRYVKNNKYLLIFYLSYILIAFANSSQVVAIYFARDCLKDESMATIVSIFFVVPALIIALLIPSITRKIDKYHIYFWSIAGMGVFSIISYFVGYENLTAFYIFIALKGICIGGFTILLYMFTPDCVEYGTYMTNERAEGITFSIQTFTIKLMSAVTTAVAMLVLGWFGFKEGLNVVQSEATLHGEWVMFSLFPVIGVILGLPVLRMYKLRSKDVQIMAEYNQGNITKEQADQLLEGRYTK